MKRGYIVRSVLTGWKVVKEKRGKMDTSKPIYDSCNVYQNGLEGCKTFCKVNNIEVVKIVGGVSMEIFYKYVVDNYTLSPEAKRMLNSIVDWTYIHYEDHGTLTSDGVDFLETIVADNIGMDRQEIIDNWFG